MCLCINANAELPERGLPSDHLEQHHAERVNIGTRIDGLPHPLFGGHIHRCAHCFPRLGDDGSFALHDLRQPEIGQDGIPIIIQQHISRF